MKQSFKLGYLTIEGLRGIFRHGLMSFASVAVVVACLLIMGCFGLIALNVSELVDSLIQQTETIAFVNEDFTEEQARAIEPLLLEIDNVESVEFVTRGEAMADFTSDYDSELFEGLDAEVFRDRYIIFVHDLEQLELTRDELKQIPGIADVSVHLSLAENFITMRNVVAAISAVLVALLLIISVFIMTNTIKLTTYERREEIAIMKAVGASNSFIRWPFCFEGCMLGVTGALISFALEWLLYYLITEKLMVGAGAFSLITPLSFESVCLPLALLFLSVGFLVGLFGSRAAIKNYLRV